MQLRTPCFFMLLTVFLVGNALAAPVPPKEKDSAGTDGGTEKSSRATRSQRSDSNKPTSSIDSRGSSKPGSIFSGSVETLKTRGIAMVATVTGASGSKNNLAEPRDEVDQCGAGKEDELKKKNKETINDTCNMASVGGIK